MMRPGRAAAVAVICLSVAGCFPEYVIPEDLDRQVNRKVSFSQLKQDAEQLKGATVVLGGVVLDAKNVEGGTRIEVLQVPLDAYDLPDGPAEASEGRFLVIDPERRDSVVLLNRRVTVVGTVLGTKTEKVDEFEYTFPYLSARFIRVWATAYEYGPGTPYPSYDPYYNSYYPYFPAYPFLYLDMYPTWYPPPGYHVVPEERHERQFVPPPTNVPMGPAPHSGGGPGRTFK